MAEVLYFKAPRILPFKRKDPAHLSRPEGFHEASRFRILCIGKNLQLLSTRCAVLGTEGYQAGLATPANAPAMLREARFDLVILCATLNEEEKGWLRTRIPRDLATLAVEHLLMPSELLSAVYHLRQKYLASSSTESSSVDSRVLFVPARSGSR